MNQASKYPQSKPNQHMSHGKFATALNCMDGRAVEAVIKWMTDEYHVDYVDSITEPGIDKYLCEMSNDQRSWLKHKIGISITGHGSRVVAIVGHDECAGNPVSPEEHCLCLQKAFDVIVEIVNELKLDYTIDIIRLFSSVDSTTHKWMVEKK